MKANYQKVIDRHKQSIDKRLDRKNGLEDTSKPVFGSVNTHYDMSERSRAINCGGIGAIHQMVCRLKLPEAINKRLNFLKRHMPYHESDHVLGITYNAMLDGKCLQDIELRRNDEGYLNALNVQRIPDPTTAGDFNRRFEESSIVALMDAINVGRQRVWAMQPRGFLDRAFLDIDGTISSTTGECKEGMSLSYKGIWGYAPLVISLANTSEPLFLVNRPGNVTSHDGCVPWINQAIEFVAPYANKITLRGDTDFSLTEHLDEWDGQEINFVFGFDAHPKLCKLAAEVPEDQWKELTRKPKYSIKTKAREKAFRYKEQVVIEKEYDNQVLKGESVTEIEYKPGKCKKPYRMVILRKNITVKKGEKELFDEIRYLFYITNYTQEEHACEEIVGLANDRCNQENVIEQLKNGVNAMKMPSDNLNSNWAYMVMCSLAWSLKAWFGLLMPNREKGLEVVRMEFRRFMNSLIMLPTQVIRTGRRVVLRIMTYNQWLRDFFDTWLRLRRIEFA